MANCLAAAKWSRTLRKLLSEHSKQYFSLSENYVKQTTNIYICHLNELNINWSLNSSTFLSSFADFINIFCVIISIEFLIKLQFFKVKKSIFIAKAFSGHDTHLFLCYSLINFFPHNLFMYASDLPSIWMSSFF